ncbi:MULTISPECIES: class I SAM-dependent methyltransferase [unclassified Polaromonas]|uniref:class I SAM-dependent methyltransferase n=1 Tax=unclassified Polaromonas TaxID=2638319 RepID=UPI0018CBB625|nr:MULTISPECIES: SAM-dependent methyltransferase [unclassified Polaromonas]MBG6072868.1 SAM-dependent MidA family methyltransferase [Polaromonas sp. CG_9.7]MBG6114982.1 SAM-dependent MidA family methyltransferase [Polaromonas sp. CG_9.2]MDH6183704.1 SAM-dependent MidA family methyltransferase [Polaromonas sp. CG_23.6]
MTNRSILTNTLQTLIAKAIDDAGGWLGFDAFMALALYQPGMGYYANDSLKFGHMPAVAHSINGAQTGGSDFVTAPELSPHFGCTLAGQVAEALQATGTDEVWEFGAGSGALAHQVLDALGDQVVRYTIVDLSVSLRERQRTRLAAHACKVRWATGLPVRMRGVVLGNEVLDAMPVKLLARLNGVWHERGVAMHAGRFAYADQLTQLRPPLEVAGSHDYVTEIHPQAEGFVGTLADRLEAGAVFLLDYGFPENEYYHPQRSMGTVMCHRAHLADGDALADVGEKDITAHVNFTGIALAGQDAGLEVLGYTSQGRFLLNCGLLDRLQDASLAGRAMAQKLVNEHEMGELFKVIAFGAKGSAVWEPMGFSAGDRLHTL